MDGTPRPVATSNDEPFTLTVDEVLQVYAAAGLSRTPRTVQRYCANAHLECRLRETRFGEKYMISPESVEKHIAYIMEVSSATGRGTSRQVEASRQIAGSRSTVEQEDPTSDASSRDVGSDRYVTQLEGEVLFLRDQVGVKDAQIKDLTERARETNHLIAGLQKMLSPLLGVPERIRSVPTEQPQERDS